jgi:nifR3 family TIM-barrel protein
MTQGLRIGKLSIGGRVLLAPMSGTTDLPFRRAAARLGAPYVASEMVACETLARGRADVLRRAATDETLGLSVVQLVGREARWFAEAARIAEDSGAHIIDLNMGCPAREVTGGLSGSALMRDLDQAERLIDAAVAATRCPVTLKMRLGWDDASMNAPALAQRAELAGIQAITVHGRTRQQFFAGTSNWHAVAAVKSATRLPVIVNGDIVDTSSARAALAQSGADAVMVGRAALGRPWLAASLERALATGEPASEPCLADRLAIVLEHFRDTLGFYGERLGLKTFRKHLARYVEDVALPGIDRREARSRLCSLGAPGEVEGALTALWARAAC